MCDGYTGAYNLLLKPEGISCWTQSNTNHIWTVAELDGTVAEICVGNGQVVEFNQPLFRIV